MKGTVNYMKKFEIGSKIEFTATLTGKFSFSTCFGNQTIYKIVDVSDPETIFVWKTSTGLYKNTVSEDGSVKPEGAFKNDTVTVKCTVKAFSEYKGEPQIEITRAKLVDVVHAVTKAQLDAKKKEEQVASLAEGDRIIKMDYKRYKNHYSDCETVAGSYVRYDNGLSDIEVIVRAGRMKNSGVRGQRYAGYEFTNELGEKAVYRAVCESNATKRVNKEKPGHKWECTHVYFYQVHHIW